MDNSLLFKGPETLNKKLKPVLEQMSQQGILVDQKSLKELSLKLGKKIARLEKEAVQVLGYEFNLNSPKQLAEVLFDDLKLPPIKRTKTGYSTDEQTLRKLLPLHPLVSVVLSYRELFKIKSTYVDSLPKFFDKESRVHTVFRTDKTATGRLTSSDPNLQNIPIKSKWGLALRKVFIPSPGFVFLSADYSQVELRILAHFSGDTKLLSTFSEGIDIHKATAAEIFKKPLERVTAKERGIAKTVNFGVIYGMSPHGLAEELSIDHKEASKFIREYFASYGAVKFYLEDLLKKAEEKGYVETLGGLRREIPELKSENMVVKNAGERMAINYPIQGTAAEIIKVAMINLFGALKKNKLKSRIILQIHDELLLEVHRIEVDQIKKLVKEKMEEVVDLRAPLKVVLTVGKNWGELK